MSQSCCSLGFLSQILFGSSLLFVGIRVYIVGYVRNVKNHFSAKQGVLATNLRLGWVTRFCRKITDWPDCHFLFYSASAIVTLQLLACFTHVVFWRVISRESLVSSSREKLFECTNTWILHTLSHITLTWFPPKFNVSNSWITRKIDMEWSQHMVE